MKHKINLSFFAVYFSILLSTVTTTVTRAQDCDRLIHDGLYSFTSMTNTKSFSKDLHTYFLSDQFKKDMSSGKWGSTLVIPIGGSLFPVGINDDETKYSELRSKLLSVSELSISSSDYQTMLSSIPNTNLYESYVNCVGLKVRMDHPGFYSGTNIETDDRVIFAIYYHLQPLASRDQGLHRSMFSHRVVS